MKQFLLQIAYGLVKPGLMTLFFISLGFSVSGQSPVTVQGTIVDETGNPMPGASVLVKGTTIGTITDIDGNYSLNAPSDAILVVSFIGFMQQEIEVNSRSKIDISMELDVTSLQEVVVIGYGEVAKRDLTGAVSTISKDVVSKTQATTIEQVLQGRAAGVNIISNDGSPGGGITINIRGNGSLTAGSQPLFVVDGIQIPPSDDPDNNPLRDINPDDIENVQILKDASATSIYGSQGGNGVVIVTTKRGSAGEPKLDLSYRKGFSELDNSVEMLSLEEYARRQQSLSIQNDLKEGIVPSSIWDDIVAFELWNDPRIQPWEDFIYHTAQEDQFHMNLGGGSEQFRYNLSMGYNNQTGVLRNSGFERLTTRLNLDQTSLDGALKVGANINFSSSTTDGLTKDGGNFGVFNRVLFTDPYLPFFNDPGDFIPGVEGEDIDLSDDVDGLFADEEARRNNNPLNYLNELEVFRRQNKASGLVFVEVKLPIEGLSFRNSLAGTLVLNEDRRFFSRESNQARGTGGRITFEETKGIFYTIESRLSYTRTFGDHRLDAVAVYEQKKDDQTRLRTGVEDIVDDSQGFYSFDLAEGIWGQSGYQDLGARNFAIRSYLARVNYSWKNRYLFTASFRNDASSKFSESTEGTGAKFWSVAGAWTASEEDFIKDLGIFSFLKFRGSYGNVGNDQVPSALTLSLMQIDLIAAGDEEISEISRFTRQLGNRFLTWEKLNQLDVGIELGFFNDRLNVNVDYFSKKTKDMLLDISLPPSVGFQSAWINTGSLSNRGLEFSLSGIAVDRGGFRWSLNGNLAIIRSEINDLGGNYERFFQRRSLDGTNDVRMYIGGGVGEWYGPVVDGVYNTDYEFYNSPVRGAESADVSNVEKENIHLTNSDNYLGHPKFVDLNGDGIADKTVKDRTNIANTIPEFTGGLGSTLEWKGFSLYGFFRYSYGNDIINNSIPRATTVVGRTNIQRTAWASAYKDDNPFGEYISSNFQGGSGWEKQTSSLFVEDGSFLRLQTLQLSYQLPSRVLDPYKLNTVRLSVTSNNVLTWTRYSWHDPEVNFTSTNANNPEQAQRDATAVKTAPGLDNGSYPRSRNIMFSISVGF